MKRSRPRPRSERRIREMTERATCRRQVLERDRFCRYPRCKAEAHEVHELFRGQLRAKTYLDPDLCVGLCHEHHEEVTNHPERAHALGLAKKSWEYEEVVP